MTLENRNAFHDYFMSETLRSSDLINEIQRIILFSDEPELSENERLTLINEKINKWRWPFLDYKDIGK